MDDSVKASIQQKVSQIRAPWFEKLHRFPDVPSDFLPWTCGLSPSALYACSLRCRKRMGIKAPEVKWMSIKRWVTSTPSGITLPDGVYYSIKRHEAFEPLPKPRFIKTVYVLLMFPYGNVWSQQSPGIPIDEDWTLSEPDSDGMILQRLLNRDAAVPVIDYFASVRKYMIENPDQIGIHLKRRRAQGSEEDEEATS